MDGGFDRAVSIILNPMSRGGGEIGSAEGLGLGDDVEIFRTGRSGEATDLAGASADEGVEILVAAGGDGTVNEVVNGIVEIEEDRRPTLAVLPLGTGNDFARTLGIHGFREAVKAIRRGTTRRTDLVRFRGNGLWRTFANASAGGFSDVVDEALDPEIKRAWGPLAYMRAAFERLGDVTEYRSRLVFDDDPGSRVEIDAVNVVVANGRYVAAGIPVAPFAEIDDGVFDVVAFRNLGIPRLAALAPWVLAGRHLDEESPAIEFRQARSLEIVADPPMPFNVDGEPVGEHPARFEILPGALEVVVGEEGDD